MKIKLDKQIIVVRLKWIEYVSVLCTYGVEKKNIR